MSQAPVAVNVGARIASTLAGMSVAVPALAAPLNLPFDVPLAPRELLLLGSLVLLVVAFAARVLRLRSPADAVSDGPDLRWWRNG